MLQKVKKIVNEIEKNSKLPIENRCALERYVLKSLVNNEIITFYNWECPPRFLDIESNRKIFVNYNVDLEAIFKGNKIDNYTELPRVVEKADNEIKTLKFLKNLGIRYRFVKIIADTNVYYITPETLKIIGKKKIKEKFIKFKNLIERSVKNYPVNVDVCLFTYLIKNYKKKYNDIYRLSSEILKLRSGGLLPKGVLNQQLERTKKHMGMSGKRQVKDFAIRTIATYAAEGIIFDKLSKTKYFSNCIWLNNHEMDQRTVDITNCFRKKLGIQNLPMIFLTQIKNRLEDITFSS